MTVPGQTNQCQTNETDRLQNSDWHLIDLARISRHFPFSLFSSLLFSVLNQVSPTLSFPSLSLSFQSNMKLSLFAAVCGVSFAVAR